MGIRDLSISRYPVERYMSCALHFQAVKLPVLNMNRNVIILMLAVVSLAPTAMAYTGRLVAGRSMLIKWFESVKIQAIACKDALHLDKRDKMEIELS
jgi:hypothetical protein